MSVSVNPPKTPVTEGSSGIAAATMPNVCKMPGPPAPFVPTPLPNIGKSGSSPKDYSKDVEFEKKKVAIRGATFKSMGDIASKGTGGGIVSSNTEGPTRFVGPGSMDVKVEGKNVQLLSDPMLNNCGPSGSPPNSATMVGVVQKSGLLVLAGDENCPLCEKTHGSSRRLMEKEETQADADKLRRAADDAIKEELRIIKAEKKLDDKDKTVKQQHNATMLGVVKCRDCDEVYAGNSGKPWRELAKQMPKAWHAPKPIEDTDFEKARYERFQNHIFDHTKKDAFNEAWQEMTWEYNEYKARADADLKNREENTDHPYYPPGSCAAQQLVVLCLDHRCWPGGLTERYYEHGNMTASVGIHIRQTPKSKAEYRRFSGSDSVPPCGTCEVILTALLCPDMGDPRCEHRRPPPKTCTKPACS